MSTPAPETPAEETAPVAPEVTVPTVVETPPVVEVAAQSTATRKGGCPVCGGALEKYLGSAIHKAGTAFCNTCGLRHILRG